MANQVSPLRTVLQRIRNDAEEAIALLSERGKEVRALGWRCIKCGHVKHFTRPALHEVAAPCPRCRGAEFVAR
ncbi:MAG: zinc ribbon-containing protein [Verrucomicrobiota bacterium]|nr:zinc ribbon-containing protein [Verrucomicrobiota bacterium]